VVRDAGAADRPAASGCVDENDIGLSSQTWSDPKVAVETAAAIAGRQLHTDSSVKSDYTYFLYHKTSVADGTRRYVDLSVPAHLSKKAGAGLLTERPPTQ
jgi:hypothetical protein